MAKYFDIDVQLIGESGNAGFIIGKVAKALKRAGATKAEIDEYRNESTSGDYNNVIQTAMRWVNVF